MAELEKIKKERAEEQERKVSAVSEHLTNSIQLVLRDSELHLVMFNEFFSWFILGARAKGRGREDPHGEHLKRKSIN